MDYREVAWRILAAGIGSRFGGEKSRLFADVWTRLSKIGDWERGVRVQDKKRLKIAMFGHKRIPSREGGVEIVVEELAARMAEKGHRVTCYNRGGHHISGVEFDTQAQAECRGVQIKTVPTIRKKGLAAVSASFFAAVHSAFGKYDVVHIHAEGPAAFCWIPRLMGKKVIVTIHGLDWQREKWKGRFAAHYIRFGEKMAARWADEVIVLSRKAQTYFKDEYNRDAVLVPNGVVRPEKREADWITQKFGLQKNSYFLYVGRLVPEKGEHYLIEAFKQVETDKKLVIAGGTSDSDGYIKSLKRLVSGDERILFTGFVQGKMLEELYSNAYVYVLPSDLEGMPLSLLEAMSYGNCCLTSDIPECIEVVENYGLSFQKGNIAELREQLQNLCEHQEIVDGYKRTASDFICRKYDWDAVVRQTLALYLS